MNYEDETIRLAKFTDPRYTNDFSLMDEQEAEYANEYEVRVTEWVEVTWTERDRNESTKEQIKVLRTQQQEIRARAEMAAVQCEEKIQSLLALPSL